MALIKVTIPIRLCQENNVFRFLGIRNPKTKVDSMQKKVKTPKKMITFPK